MFEKLVDLPQYAGLNDQIYEVLRNAILQHTLPAGSKLDVNLLAKRWGVSRTPVKDALQRLMMEGLVTVIPRRGTFVASIDVEELLGFMDVRLMFELRAAELVIGHINQEQLLAMKRILTSLDDLMQAEPVDFVQCGVLDRELHALPILWTKNDKLYQIYQAQNIRWCMTRPLKSMAAQSEHWEIYKAYELRSLEAVKTAINKHIEAAKARIIELSAG